MVLSQSQTPESIIFKSLPGLPAARLSLTLARIWGGGCPPGSFLALYATFVDARDLVFAIAASTTF